MELLNSEYLRFVTQAGHIHNVNFVSDGLMCIFWIKAQFW